MSDVFNGLDELREALLNLPKQLRDDAAAIVNDAANSTARDVRAAYERVRTPTKAKGYKSQGGHLADNVRVTEDTSGGESYALARVKSMAPHASLYEYGTADRAWKSGKSTGSMPAHPTMIPTAVRERRQMHDRLIEMVKAAGLEVSGG